MINGLSLFGGLGVARMGDLIELECPSLQGESSDRAAV
jgi:hypothetical protein